MSGWRVVLISQILPGVRWIDELVRGLGHETLALLTVRSDTEPSRGVIAGAPEHLDVVAPSSRNRIAPLLRVYEPDLTICLGFPWKIPPAALAVSRLGVLNIHPSLLPRYRGPSPISWALRNGDRELGVTVHRMDTDLDTGPILAQGTAPLPEAPAFEDVGATIAGLIAELLPPALERVARGEEGEPQGEDGASYAGFLEDDYARVDWTRPAREIHNQVLAWRFNSKGDGALAELDGETVRILRTRLDPGEGTRVECGDGPIWVVETEPAQ